MPASLGEKKWQNVFSQSRVNMFKNNVKMIKKPSSESIC